MKPDSPRKQRPRILFVGNQNSSFVANDYLLLQAHYPVTALSLTQGGSPIRSLPRFIIKLMAALGKTDVVFCWFANAESFLPVLLGRLLGKKTVVVAGGYDCANEPSFHYGSFAHPVKRHIAGYILNHADLILAVSKFTEHEAVSCSHPRRILTTYNGVDIEKFTPDTAGKEDLVLTIARVDRLNILLKGLRTFAEASRAIPQSQFVIIGPTEESCKQELLRINPALTFVGGLPHDDLVPWFRRAKVYCQLSYRESFGLALVEAMSCGCIPVTTDRGALPEVVGDCGLVVPYEDAPGTIAAISQASRRSPDSQTRCRQRVVSLFSLQGREEHLVKIIEDLAR
jgi:glycosyltransferase involved in cell wall biosynthesis